MNHPEITDPHAGDSPEQRLRAVVEHAGHLLPAQGPIGVFVHHNTLHAFQHLPFHEAVVAASAVYDAEPYLSEVAYRESFAAGRIDEGDLEAALAERHAGKPDERRGPLSRYAIERLALRYPMETETAAGLAWHIAEKCVTRRSDADRALWEACRAVPLPPAPPAERPIVDRVGRAGADRTHRDLLLALTGEDPAGLIDPSLIRLLSAYLDEGVAHWIMPERASGIWPAFRALMLEGPRPVAPFLAGLPEEIRRLDAQGLGLAPEAVVLRALDELGVPEAAREAYLTRVLLELPGWAGMVNRLEHTPSDRPPGAPPVSLVDYLAVRLTLARHALREVARRGLGYEGPLAGLVEHARRAAKLAAPPPRSPDHERPYRLYQLTHHAGLSAAQVEAMSASDRLWALSVLEGFDQVSRRRVWHEAYERHHRAEVLHAIAANMRRPMEERAVRDPRFQVVCCIDDRCEGLRRHFEELSPRHETLGVGGFFGVPIHYRGLDDAGHAALCPLGVEPAYTIVERSHEEEAGERRGIHRKRWARFLHALGHGTRTLTRGVLLTPTVGLLQVIPLVGRVLFPRAAARLRQRLAARLLPRPETRLHDPHELEAPEDARTRPFTVEEKAARVAATLQNMGLTRGFAPLVALLGHGATTANNPHQSAYDCGACGGRHGGPNARLFASIANDPAVRALLRGRGIDIPDGTWFVGGLYNTTTDGITFHDERLVPPSHRAEFSALVAALDQARKRHAHERCRRFESAPRNLDPERALAHVEERAEDLSQARPELGHVTNAVCVFGRRALTRGLFLDRRAFLVSYDPTQDPAGAILERILLALGPVGAGINLEYYFSCVDNARYGCGTKLPHNLASLLGVMEGSLGDLRTGLPRQMIEIHEPVRLLVIVEASEATAAGVCERQPAVRELVENGWIQLACVDPETGTISRYTPAGFEPFTSPDSPLPAVSRSADWYAGKSGFVPPALIRAASTRPRPRSDSHAAA